MILKKNFKKKNLRKKMFCFIKKSRFIIFVAVSVGINLIKIFLVNGVCRLSLLAVVLQLNN